MNALEIISSSTEVEFKNSTLAAATKAIASIGTTFRSNLYRLAVILSKIDAENAYKEDGFKNTADYAEKTFGFKKSMSYTLIKVGKDYITDGTIESVLPHEMGHDYTVSQIEKLLPLKSVDTARNLAENETINPDMSCKEIEEIVKKELKKDEIETTGEEKDETETAETETEAAETEETKPRTKEDIINEIISRISELTEFIPSEKKLMGDMITVLEDLKKQ